MADHRRAATLRTIKSSHTKILDQHTSALADMDAKITALIESVRRIEILVAQAPQIAKQVRDIRSVQEYHTSVLEWIATALGLRLARQNTLDRAEDMV